MIGNDNVNNDEFKPKPSNKLGDNSERKDGYDNPWNFLGLSEAAIVASSCRANWLLVFDQTMVYDAGEDGLLVRD